MRIVAGAHRGRTLDAPRGTDTRPTSDRVREAVFSALEARFDAIDGSSVLDAFAGSGALGLEALSRGASRVTFIERERAASSCVARNLDTLGLSASATIVRADTFTAARSRLPGAPFALLFVDPPYRIVPAQVSALLGDLVAGGALEPGAVIVYEHAASEGAQWPPGFRSEGEKRYGDTSVSYAVWEGEPR